MLEAPIANEIYTGEFRDPLGNWNRSPEEVKRLRLIEAQRSFLNHNFRFAINHSGRRSGKTEISIRKVVRRGLKDKVPKRYFLGAPTYGHAKKLFWNRTKKLIKQIGTRWIDKSEGELRIMLPTGSEIWCVGFDAKERFDGMEAWHGGVADEYADMDEDVWTEHIRPALMDTGGWCDFTGVPNGRNHFYVLDQEYGLDETKIHWGSFWWASWDVLPMYLGRERAEEEIRQAKEDLDEITFRQELGGEFVAVQGRAYYNFDKDEHASFPQSWDKDDDLCLTFDFNASPGTAGAVQERDKISRVIGEVWIQENSNTEMVCDRILQKWGEHRGMVYCYGDASGGAKGAANVKGSNWDLVKNKLAPRFGQRLQFKVPRKNPAVVARVNALNSRLKSVSGKKSFFIDPSCTYSIRCFEGTVGDGAGGIRKDKKKDKWVTHLTDGYGYREDYEHPVDNGYEVALQQI